MKEWWKSRGVWGGIVAILAGVAGAWGYTIAPDDQETAINLCLALSSAVGGVVAIIGRVMANKQIGVKK